MNRCYAPRAVTGDLQPIIDLAVEVQHRRSLEDLLQAVVDHTAKILAAEHGSIRLLNPSRTHLVAVCRTGTPLHLEPVDFALGEGLIGWIAEQEQPIRTADPEHDPRYSPRPKHEPMGRFLGVPLVSGRVCMGVLSVLRSTEPFTEADEQLLTLVAAICAPYLEIARLSRLSQVDPLTGALNRRGMEASYEERLADNEATAGELSLMMVDIDHFKAINDTHGHAVGDEVLRHVARVLSGVLRISDAIVRYGGEEFILLFPDVGLGRALRIADRARQAVAENPTPIDDVKVDITVSIGVAERHPAEPLAALVRRADTALYEAKQTGRNRVCAA
jgi:diguanylate cyclase (GGDEF)-like protein